ncbi:MAG: type II toxin-antitoxin system HipA family toxin [Pirellula sp.]
MKYVPVKILNVFLAFGDTPLQVGRLALVRRKIYFEYSPSFIARGLEISPAKLPLQSGAKAPVTEIFDGLFGVFNDSLPDGWGRLLLDRQVQALGIAPEKLGPLDRLTHVGNFGMGALVYEPCEPHVSKHPHQLDLDRLAEESTRIAQGEQISTELLELAGSSAGARPKIMVGISDDATQFIHGQQDLPTGFEHWMIKFTSNQDREDAGNIEYAYSLMAKAAGIEMMPTKLFLAKKGVGYFGVKRFDRVLTRRVHLHSVSGLIDANHQMPSIDYDHVLRATYFLTKNISEVKKAFRLSCFNVFAHNRDDHAKNFAYLMDEEGNWRLSPAYDLTFSGGPGGEHCTTVSGEGKHPAAEHLLLLASTFSIGAKEAKQIIEQVKSVVLDWKRYAEMASVARASATMITKEISS